jgi:hypothetical protein
LVGSAPFKSKKYETGWVRGNQNLWYPELECWFLRVGIQNFEFWYSVGYWKKPQKNSRLLRRKIQDEKFNTEKFKTFKLLILV